ncbi:hypothetical protein GQ53DRAFT_607590, partial [Thozetella sp. PMI_491]
AATSGHAEAAERAPSYTIPARKLTAVEHPLIVKDIDKAVKTFGQSPSFKSIFDSSVPQLTVPLYLRYENPTVRPIPSFNSPTHNLVLEVSVPKRTGRKRKRGTVGPFEGDIAASGHLPAANPPEVYSQSTLDAPKILRRKLRDNVGNYTIKPAGVIKRTHRYRGFTDFQFAVGRSKFMNNFVGSLVPGEVSKLRQFTIKPGVEKHAMVDIVPPPFFTSMTLPYPYHYSQNIYTKQVQQGRAAAGHISEDEEFGHIVNVTSRPPTVGYFLRYDEYPVPTKPRHEPDMSDPQVAMIITEMHKAMDERPIWTRRSMWNRLATKFETIEDPQKGALGPRSGALIKYCLPFVGYQFKGGPWRDAMVRYGIDPRKDPRYRIYQTLIFKLHKTRVGNVGRSWHAVRTEEIAVKNYGKFWEHKLKSSTPRDTHIFDGQSYHTDGKVWQVCDITDPLLKRFFEQAEVRRDVDIEISGWYYRVLWAVGKAIMKSKMVGIRFNRNLTDEDFRDTIRVTEGPHDGGDTTGSKTSISISLPELNLTTEEMDALRISKLRPGPPNLKRTYDDNYNRKTTGYVHRQRIKIKDREKREVRKMIRLLNGPGQAGDGQGSKGDGSGDEDLSEGTGPEESRDDDAESIDSFLGDLDEEGGSGSESDGQSRSESESYDGDNNIGAIDYDDEEEEEEEEEDEAEDQEDEYTRESPEVDNEEIEGGEDSDSSGYRQVFGIRQSELLDEGDWDEEDLGFDEGASGDEEEDIAEED